MKKIVLFILIILAAAAILAYYPARVEKPLKDGPGPLSVYISAQYAAPEYHNPLEYWKTHHTEIVNRGDLVQADCLHCHEPERSCNNCHGYVGVDAIAPLK